MKKLIAMILCIAMIVSLTACGDTPEAVELPEVPAGAPVEQKEAAAPVVEEPEIEEEVNILDSAVSSVESGTGIYLVTADGEYLCLSDNGWHISLSSEKKSPLRIDAAGAGFYVFTSDQYQMRINVYEDKVGIEGAGVAMYPNNGPFERNEKFQMCFIEDGLGFKLQTTAGLYLHVSSTETDASLAKVKGATVFYMIEE